MTESIPVRKNKGRRVMGDVVKGGDIRVRVTHGPKQDKGESGMIT